MIRILEFTVRPINLMIEEFGKVLLLFLSAATWTIRPPFRFGVLFKQMEFVGVNSLTVVAVTKIFTGMVFALHTFYGFRLFDRDSLVINIKSRPQAAGLSGSNRHRAFYPAAHLSNGAK